MPRERYEQAKRELEARALEETSEVRHGLRPALPVRRLDGRARRRHDSDRGPAALCGSGQSRRLRAGRRTRCERWRRAPGHAAGDRGDGGETGSTAADRTRQRGRLGHARAYLLRAQPSRRGRARVRPRDHARSRQRRSAGRLRRRAGCRRGRAQGQVARAHRSRAQGRSDPLEGPGARWHCRVQPQGLQERRRVLGKDEGDRSTGLTHRRIDRRQHRGGTGAGRTSCGRRRREPLGNNAEAPAPRRRRRPRCRRHLHRKRPDRPARRSAAR